MTRRKTLEELEALDDATHRLRNPDDEYYSGVKQGFLIGLVVGLFISGLLALFIWSLFYA